MSGQDPNDGSGASTPVGEPPGKVGEPPGKKVGVIIGELFFGTLLAFLLCAAWARFEHTEFGEEFSQLTYGFLQRRLQSQGPWEVQIVDISELAPEAGITPRNKLKWLLFALKDVEPKVIGIDVDFSPEEKSSGVPKRWQFVTPDDYKFFDKCLSLRKQGVKVYLGIYRTQLLDPKTWLGMERYAPLAATLLAPERPMKALRFSEVQKGLTMASALADVDSKVREAPRHKWLVFERASKSESESIPSEAFLVDYSRIERLQFYAIKVPREDFGTKQALTTFIQRNKSELKGRRILVGDVAHYGDPFPNLIHRGSIPGVLIHAAAAETLLGNPLYDMVEWLKGWADFLLTEVLLLITLVLRWFVRRKTMHTAEWVLTLLMIAATLVFGVTVNLHRILWDGFLIVAIALALHPVADKILRPPLRWLRLLKED